MQAPAELDANAAQVMRSAFARLRGYYEPTACELLLALAVGRHETGFGTLGQFKGSNNWGAIICARHWLRDGPPCSDCFSGAMQGVGGVRWRRYASPEEGAFDMLRELDRRPKVRAAMAAGNVADMAEAMRESGYFIAPDSKAYAAALGRHVNELERSLGVACAAPQSAGESGSSGSGWAAFVALLAGAWAARRKRAA